MTRKSFHESNTFKVIVHPKMKRAVDLLSLRPSVMWVRFWVQYNSRFLVLGDL